MGFVLTTVIAALALFGGMLALIELGAHLGRRRLERDPEGARAGTAAADGTVFALLGLLIAFSFSGASERFERRRSLVVAEANAIGTAWLRLELLPEASRAAVQDAFRAYVDARLDVYRGPADLAVVLAALQRSDERQGELWRSVSSAASAAAGTVPMLLLAPVNEMFDLATERRMAFETHPPDVIFGLLFALALASALLAGFAMAGARQRNWTQRIAFALVIAATVWVILDLEYPRRGLIRVDASDHVLYELRESMG